MTETPRVSICMPTYNRAAYISRTLETVLKQTYADFELIINDDNSSDGTEDVVRSFADSRIKYYRNEVNLRMPGNLNGAILKAVGEYIVVFHDHDLYEPTVLEEMVSVLDRNPDVGFVHTGIFWLNIDTGKKTRLVGPWDEMTSGRQIFENILWKWDCPICALTMVRKRCYESVGLYDPQFGFISDVDMWMRLSLSYDVGYIAKPLITCLERETDHLYARFNWELPCLNVKTHMVNLKRCYAGKMLSHFYFSIKLKIKTNEFIFRQLLYLYYKKDSENIIKSKKIVDAVCGNIGASIFNFITDIYTDTIINTKHRRLKKCAVSLYNAANKLRIDHKYGQLWGEILKPSLSGKGLCVGGRIPGVNLIKLNVEHLNVVDEYAGENTSASNLCDAHEMNHVSDNQFDYAMTSHVIEHSPSPIRLILELVRVVRVGGYLYNIIPDKNKIYDKCRRTTELSHIIKDYENNTFIEDKSHHEEYFCMLEDSEGMKEFHAKHPVDYPYIHYHTFDPASASELFRYLKLELVTVETINENICILTQVTSDSKNMLRGSCK